jgi:hypothetical protein
LIPTAANGFALGGAIDYVGSITNPSWTSLSTNGTMYLYLDIASNGTCTTGSTTLEPTYRSGGADVVTNNQFTFNYQEMVGKVGNGSVATQTYRVFVGQVTVAGAVVTAITWYALMGRYEILNAGSLPGSNTQTSFNHHIGTNLVNATPFVENVTTQSGWVAGDRMPVATSTSGGGSTQFGAGVKRLTATVSTGDGSAFVGMPTAGGNNFVLTAASWRLGMRVTRSF